MRLGLTFAAVSSLLIGGFSVTYAWAAPSFGYQRAVVKSFYDAHGREVLLRRGWWDAEHDRGFGWDKIVGKHKITNVTLVEKIINNPNGGEPQGTARVYRGFAQRFTCDMSGRCVEMERIPLKAIVEFRTDPNMNGQKGVIGAYCEYGRPDCPSWVSNVANVAPA